jgi:hypothetical protein
MRFGCLRLETGMGCATTACVENETCAREFTPQGRGGFDPFMDIV